LAVGIGSLVKIAQIPTASTICVADGT